jgi:Ca2+-binding RTX toxin-like protein
LKIITKRPLMDRHFSANPTRAGSGNDEIHAGDGNDAVDGGGSNDEIHGDGGDDVIFGGVGSAPASGVGCETVHDDPADPECGDGSCDAGEDSCSCAEDCGKPEHLWCSDELDSDCDFLIDCEDEDCSTTDECTSPPPDECGNNVCDPGEDCSSCSQDCEGRTTGKKSRRFCCGDGTAQSAEGGGSVCAGNY